MVGLSATATLRARRPSESEPRTLARAHAGLGVQRDLAALAARRPLSAARSARTAIRGGRVDTRVCERRLRLGGLGGYCFQDVRHTWVSRVLSPVLLKSRSVQAVAGHPAC
jgi:hypothetical protein